MSQFTPCSPRRWTGRYNFLQGTRWTLLHLEGRWWPVIEWMHEDTKLTCLAVESPATSALAEAVARTKVTMGGSGGGGFLINEFGQVIVPASSGNGHRMLTGQVSGPMEYENPLEGTRFTLGDDEGLSPGDEWELPYVGAQFNLGNRNKIYYWKDDEDTARSLFPDEQDEALIARLRAVRPTGAVRFIVNPAGICLTKKQVGPDWIPFYAGRVDMDQWFDKEE